MSDTPISNGMNGYLKWGVTGTVGAGSLLSMIAFLINLYVAPLKENIAELQSELRGISKLAAERGQTIPRLQADLARLEARMDRLEATPHGQH